MSNIHIDRPTPWTQAFLDALPLDMHVCPARGWYPAIWELKRASGPDDADIHLAISCGPLDRPENDREDYWANMQLVLVKMGTEERIPRGMALDYSGIALAVVQYIEALLFRQLLLSNPQALAKVVAEMGAADTPRVFEIVAFGVPVDVPNPSAWSQVFSGEGHAIDATPQY